MVIKFLNSLKQIFKNDETNTNINIKNFHIVKNYEEYKNFLDKDKDKDIIKLVIFTKEDCDECIRGLNIVTQLSEKYAEKIEIVEVKCYKDSSKNDASSQILGQYNIYYVPSYIIMRNEQYEKIYNENFNYLDKKIKNYLDL